MDKLELTRGYVAFSSIFKSKVDTRVKKRDVRWIIKLSLEISL